MDVSDDLLKQIRLSQPGAVIEIHPSFERWRRALGVSRTHVIEAVREPDSSFGITSARAPTAMLFLKFTRKKGQTQALLVGCQSRDDRHVVVWAFKPTSS